ncbi:hypothetical protein UWO_04266 [Escherichia coli O32:H37 str. P4]|nr:hypothetical protein UWO_04266 [Escherichia coli O32:H37 str. P4]
MKITPEQAREALDAWICRPGMTQEQATILITEAFWALKERPNIDVQRVTYEGGAIDQRALGVNRVKIFERWKATLMIMAYRSLSTLIDTVYSG